MLDTGGFSHVLENLFNIDLQTYIDGKGFFKNFKKKAHDYDYLDNIASDVSGFRI